MFSIFLKGVDERVLVMAEVLKAFSHTGRATLVRAWLASEDAERRKDAQATKSNKESRKANNEGSNLGILWGEKRR